MTDTGPIATFTEGALEVAFTNTSSTAVPCVAHPLGATFTVDTDANGDVIAVTLVNPGDDYSVNETITVMEEQGAGRFEILVTSVS